MRFSYPEMPDERPAAPSPAPAPVPTAAEPQQQEQPEGAMKVVATALSWILVPLFMPVYGIVLIFTLTEFSTLPSPSKWGVGCVLAALNVVLPMVLICILKILGWVQDVALNNQKERTIPYVITFLGVGLSALYLGLIGAPRWIWSFYAGGAIAALCCMVVNRWWKISAHGAGMAGIVALLAVIGHLHTSVHSMEWWLVGAVVLAGLLGSSRVFLYRHTPLQVVAGYAVGFLPVYLLAVN